MSNRNPITHPTPVFSTLRAVGLGAALCAASSPSRADAAEPSSTATPAAQPSAPSSEYRRIPFTMSLFPPVSVNAVERTKKVENAFAINVILGKAARIRGVELGLGANWATEEVRGAQLGVAANVVGGKLRGAQWSTGVNVARDGMAGLQATVGVNVASTRRARDQQQQRGAQLAVLANFVRGDFEGLQLGGGVNVASNVRGAQIGLVNVTRERVHGAQLGLVNYADDADASIGLVPITRKAGVGGELWTDDIAAINAGLRLGTRRFYTVLSLGAHPFRQKNGGHANLGFTIGGRIDVHERVFVDIDFGVRGVVPGFRNFDEMPAVGLTRIRVGGRVGKRLAVVAGPTFAAAFVDDEEYPGFRPGYRYDVFSKRVDDLRIRIWPGFAAGLQF